MTCLNHITVTASESARWLAICRTLHLPSAGLKSSSGPAAPVVVTASSTAPRRNRSSSSASSPIVSIVIGAAHVVAALFTEELAFYFGKPAAADRTVEHRFVLDIGPACWRARFGLSRSVETASVAKVRLHAENHYMVERGRECQMICASFTTSGWAFKGTWPPSWPRIHIRRSATLRSCGLASGWPDLLISQ